MKWNIIVHPKAALEINKLPIDMRAKLTRILELIENVGPLELREPHVKSLGHKLMEIRLTGKSGISRIVYVVLNERKVTILHAFVKKTQKTSRSVIECALKRLKEIKDEKVS